MNQYICACGETDKNVLYCVSSEAAGLKDATMCRQCYYEWLKANCPSATDLILDIAEKLGVIK